MKWGASVVLEERTDMPCSFISKNNSAKDILNLLEVSHIILTYAIVTLVKSTADH